jgi:hypothetical protein
MSLGGARPLAGQAQAFNPLQFVEKKMGHATNRES